MIVPGSLGSSLDKCFALFLRCLLVFWSDGELGSDIQSILIDIGGQGPLSDVITPNFTSLWRNLVSREPHLGVAGLVVAIPREGLASPSRMESVSVESLGSFFSQSNRLSDESLSLDGGKGFGGAVWREIRFEQTSRSITGWWTVFFSRIGWRQNAIGIERGWLGSREKIGFEEIGGRFRSWLGRWRNFELCGTYTLDAGH